jgi:hypothetical protein
MKEFKGRITYIYALMDGSKVKYIGKSDEPYKRFVYHLKYGKKTTNYRQNWVNKMVRENKEISLKILEAVPYEIWEEREIYWISKYGLKNLVNLSVGGKGRKYPIKKDKNLKITSKTHEILKKYCEDNNFKIFDFVESIIKENIKSKNRYEKG